MKIGHILVATDLSDESLSCVAPVADLARSLGARITLLHVVERLEAIPHGAPFAPPLVNVDLPAHPEALRERLQQRRSAFGADLDVRVDQVVGGNAAEEICDYADANGADAIAVATHGRTGFRHLVMGSVTESVVKRSRVPVFVFPRPKR
jgi:nucleotide-binding universal stress UspA family protein